MGDITKQQIPVLAARLVEFQEKFNCLSAEDGQYVIQETVPAIQLFTEAIIARRSGLHRGGIMPPISRCLSSSENLMIEALDGSMYIVDAEDTFTSHIEGDFKAWALIGCNVATPETIVDVDEIVSDANLAQIFFGLTYDLEKIVMTQHQIIRFCRKYPHWLREEKFSTFFLTKVRREYLVIRVGVSNSGPGASVIRFGDSKVLDGGARRRVVYPRLKLLAK